MAWTICFIISLFVFFCSVLRIIKNAIWKPKKQRENASPARVLFVAIFVSLYIVLIPVYFDKSGGIKSLFVTLYGTMQVFSLDSDIFSVIENRLTGWFASCYNFYLSVLYILAPILTFGFILSFFRDISSSIKYVIKYFGNVYIFSELNEKTINLVLDIRKNHAFSTIVITNIIEDEEKETAKNLSIVRSQGVVLFNKDISEINFKRHFGKSKIIFFIINKDKNICLEQSISVAERYKNRSNTMLYTFVCGNESEMALNKFSDEKIRIRYISEPKALINRMLLEKGNEIFEKAIQKTDRKHIGVLIVGLGEYGLQLLKTLTWYCQMDGYEIGIDAFDEDPLAKEKFEKLCPELMSDKINKKKIEGESEYSITIHSGIDVKTNAFNEEIKKLSDISVAYICLGNDSFNITTAVDVRIAFERLGVKPEIKTIVSEQAKTNALQNATNFKGQPYDIEYFGSLESIYRENVIINSELDKEALERHIKWGDEEDFWKYDYNYSSSIATSLHMRARIACKIPGADKKESELSLQERHNIEILEHKRWNAYMRSIGYVYSGSTDASTRNDLAKMHHNIIPFKDLSEEDKRKDSKVGTK